MIRDFHKHVKTKVLEKNSPGGLFHASDSKQEQAFLFAVDRINADKSIIPKSKLSAQVEEITPFDSFHASKRVCHLLRTGVAAVFGPQSGKKLM